MEKIVGGKIDKWYSEVCLMRQPWIRDDKSCLEKVAPKLTVVRFLRWVVGEEL
jgi:elongation factor Ts